MKFSVEFVRPINLGGSMAHFCRLKSTCANNRVAARNPFGHVGVNAPSQDYELRLVLHHIVGVTSFETII